MVYPAVILFCGEGTVTNCAAKPMEAGRFNAKTKALGKPSFWFAEGFVYFSRLLMNCAFSARVIGFFGRKVLSS